MPSARLQLAIPDLGDRIGWVGAKSTLGYEVLPSTERTGSETPVVIHLIGLTGLEVTMDGFSPRQAARSITFCRDRPSRIGIASRQLLVVYELFKLSTS